MSVFDQGSLLHIHSLIAPQEVDTADAVVTAVDTAGYGAVTLLFQLGDIKDLTAVNKFSIALEDSEDGLIYAAIPAANKVEIQGSWPGALDDTSVAGALATMVLKGTRRYVKVSAAFAGTAHASFAAYAILGGGYVCP